MLDTEKTFKKEIEVNSQSKHSKKTLNDNEMISQMLVFIFAGSDTTATTLTFLAYSLAKHPEIQYKVYEEIEKAFKEHVNSEL